MRRKALMSAIFASTLSMALLAPQAAFAQRPGTVETPGDKERKRLSEMAKTDPAAAEQEALRLIADTEATTGLGTDYAKDLGDALRGIYADQRRDGDKIALLERFYRWNLARVGNDHESTLDWVIRLAFDLEGLERYDEAEKWFVMNLEARRRMNADPTEDSEYELIQAARNYANFNDRLQRWDKSEAAWLEAIAVSGEVYGPAHEDTLEWMDFLGRSYGDAARYDKQADLYRRMIALIKSDGDDPDGYYANLYTQRLAEALTNAGQRQDALAAYETVEAYDQGKAESALDRLSSSDRRTLLMAEGRFDEVEALLLEDMAMLKREGREDLLSIPVLGLAEFYDDRQQYDKSDPYWRQAIALQDADFYSVFQLARQGLANSLTRQGRLVEAEAMWRELIALEQANAKGDLYRSAMFIGSVAALGQVLIDQGRSTEAELLLLDVLGRGQIEDDVKSALDVLGRLYVDQGRDKEALAIFERLRNQSARLDGGTGIETRNLNAQIAEIRARGGDIGELIAVHESNLVAYRNMLGPNEPLTRSTMQRLAALYARRGRLGEAESLLSELSPDLTVRDTYTFELRSQLALLAWQRGDGAAALAQYASLIKDSRDVLGPANNMVMTYLAIAAELGLRERQYATALPFARNLAAGLDEQRIANSEQLTSEAQQSAISAVSEDGYRALADIAWSVSVADPREQAKLRPEVFAALQNAMTSKTDRAIARSVARRLADEEGGPLAELIRRIETVQQSRDAASRAITNSFSQSTEASFRLRTQKVAERDALSKEFAELDRQLRAEYPDYFALVRADPVTMESISKTLSADEALLLIMPGPRGTHVMAVVDGQLHWHRSSVGESEMNQHVRRLLYFLGGDVKPSGAETALWLDSVDGGQNGFDRATAQMLYRELFLPLEDRLTGKTRLIIAAGGSLATLPFSVLVTGDAAGDDDDPQALRQTPWLAEKYALVQIPSIQSFAFLRARRDNAGAPNNQFIGFGDPLLNGRSVRRGKRSAASLPSSVADISTSDGNDARIDPARLRALSRLPGTSDELKAMQRLFGAGLSTILLADQSTETNVKQADLTKADVLAFATHALTTGEIKGAMEPGLVFTPPIMASEMDDGYLTASEVSQLRLSADWVILSACNTASGDGAAGSRGLSGLARSFFYAGAGNLLASHWPVRDDVASRLTVRIIEIGRDNPDMTRADAFQRAMREIRQTRSFDGVDPAGDQQSWAHPNAWAPFMLIGDGR